MRIAHNEPASNFTIRGAYDDFIRVYEDDSLVECNHIIDDYHPELFNKAHRDGIQLIPSGKRNAQYAAATLANVTIRNNKIQSGNKLQGIFSSDGLLENLTVTGNTIDTQGQHYITLNGVLSGRIEGNRRSNGSLCPVLLKWLRLGGNDGTGNVWVVGFSDGTRYEPVVTDPILNHVIDLRLTRPTPRLPDLFLMDFDLTAFIRAVAKHSLAADQLQTFATQYGTALA